jgi:hypothetical protein
LWKGRVGWYGVTVWCEAVVYRGWGIATQLHE